MLTSLNKARRIGYNDEEATAETQSVCETLKSVLGIQFAEATGIIEGERPDPMETTRASSGKKPRIIAVCTSERKGMRKRNVHKGALKENYGLLGDAHSDSCSHRQVSFLAMESIEKMRQKGLDVGPGDFAENFTTQGIDLPSLPVGTQIALEGGSIVEVSQIGKECHTPCAIYYQAGTCVMPSEGIFARVIRGGSVSVGDTMEVRRRAGDTASSKA
jgi:MOSC domain-containing protein YiiM